MAAFIRRQYAGAAVATTLTAGINASATTCSLAANTGWPSSAGVPFYVVIDPGTSTEEKCSATISGTTLTLTRAQDDTSASSHASGAVIYPVFTANDADEANRLASAMTTRGDLVTLDSGTNPARLAVGAANTVLKSDGTDPSYGLILTANITDANVTEGKLASNAVTSAKINNAAVTSAKINDGAVTAAKLGTATAGTTGQVLIADTVEAGGLRWASGVAAMTELDVQTFSSSTTYTVVANAKVIVVECIGAGGGGGGGARNTGTSSAGGGAGGAGAPYERCVLAASEVGATATVTVAAGGAGGAGRTGSTGDGTAGSVGGTSRFGTFYFLGGRRGNEGTTAGGGGGADGYTIAGAIFNTGVSKTGFGASGFGSLTSSGSDGNRGFRGGGGGGGGGGRSATDRAGGAGGSSELNPTLGDSNFWTAQGGLGGAAGAAGAGAGGAGSASAGGGGGGSSNTATGGAGGAGDTGGGGGGGAGANGDNNGGNGGNGGNAQIKIWVFG